MIPPSNSFKRKNPAFRIPQSAFRNPHSLGLAFGLLALILPLALLAANDDARLDNWIAAQTNMNTWKAELIQTRSLKTMTQPLMATGRVWVARPNQFRFELGQPPQIIALRLPDQMLLIYPKLKRVEKYPLDTQKAGPWKDVLTLIEAGFPKSRADVDKHFKILSMVPTNDLMCLTMQPTSATMRRMLPEIKTTIRTNDSALTATEIKSADGSSMRNDFFNAEINSVFPPDIFKAPIEPGFTIVEPAGPQK
ncbi:MAG: outer membrane lipoprotein carrier protein LolA [Verrucomicrobiota bacterium]